MPEFDKPKSTQTPKRTPKAKTKKASANTTTPTTMPPVRPQLGAFFRWIRTHDHWWQFSLKILTFIVAIVGTWLLLNQNKLLENQNTLIQRQMYLEEANRRSALVVLMSNILDKVDKEIEAQKEILPKSARNTAHFTLSQSLIGQITALSHSFKPYRYMDSDTLISRPLSPERGQLLITIVLLPLDTITLQDIYKTATFRDADLKGAMLNGRYLCKADLRGANLSKANLSRASLVLSVLNGADLRMADFSKADFRGAVLVDGDLRGVNLEGADLRDANFNRVDLGGANLSSSNLKGADLINADLSGALLFAAILSGVDLRGAVLKRARLYHTDLSWADLRGADLSMADLSWGNLISVNFDQNQWDQIISLYEATLPDTSKTKLLKTHPQLFEKPDVLKLNRR